jgi:hypothetical protein
MLLLLLVCFSAFKMFLHSLLTKSVVIYFSFLSLSLSVFGTDSSTQGLKLSRQVLYHLRHFPSFFCFRCFCIGSHFMQQTGLEHKLPVYASHIARTTGAGHHAQLLVEMGGSPKLFAWAGLELRSSRSLSIARIIGFSHHT